jgi:hypothetical protein
MCKHCWANLVAKKGKKIFPVSNLKVCLKCGQFKVGRRTIRISKDRIDMDGKEIRNLGYLQIPRGTDKYK